MNEAVSVDNTEVNSTATIIDSAVLKKAIKNRYGEMHGYSGCHSCGDRYNWKEVHHISMKWPEIRVTLLWRMAGGAFPYCEECDGKLHRRAKIRAMLALGVDWVRQSPPKHWLECISSTVFHILLILAGR